MTCIVGLEHGGHVYIGGDSAAVGGLDLDIRRDEKVFHVGEFTMGFTDSFRMGQILRYVFDPPEQPPSKEDMAYLVTDVVDHVRECFSSRGFMRKEQHVEAGGTFLLGYRGKLYTVDNDFQVGRSRAGYAAIGCGGSIALGALYATAQLDPVERVRVALKAAARWSAGVRPPFEIISTASNLGLPRALKTDSG